MRLKTIDNKQTFRKIIYKKKKKKNIVKKIF